jgi:hypothetical protein
MDKGDGNRTVDPLSGDALARMDEVSRDYVLKRGKLLSQYVERMNRLRLGPELDALEMQYLKECADLRTQYLATTLNGTKISGEETMLEENIPAELNAFLGKPGEAVPAVDPADLKAVWMYCQETRAQHPQAFVGYSVEIFRQLCSPNADLKAVWYRSTMLGLLEAMLESACAGGKLTENAFTVVAQMQLQWMGVGTVHRGLPFDVGEFLGQVHGLSLYRSEERKEFPVHQGSCITLVRKESEPERKHSGRM